MDRPSEPLILMYHSIGLSPAPTGIPPEVFRMQIETIAGLGYTTISFETFNAWHAGKDVLPSLPVLITFDDGFADFADVAFPVLNAHGYRATVFLPTHHVGKLEDWSGAHIPPRRLMNWSTAADLVKEGIDFGGHTCTHRDLTRLTMSELVREIRVCREDIEKHLGFTPVSFAPPYGLAGIREREEIRKCFTVSVGTRLSRANRNCDRYDVPRIEMHYFRNPKRWRNFAGGNGEWHFRIRRTLREARKFVKPI